MRRSATSFLVVLSLSPFGACREEPATATRSSSSSASIATYPAGECVPRQRLSADTRTELDLALAALSMTPEERRRAGIAILADVPRELRGAEDLVAGDPCDTMASGDWACVTGRTWVMCSNGTLTCGAGFDDGKPTVWCR